MQEPLGKAVLGLITRNALHQSQSQLQQIPQCSYMPFRSTNDSIRQVVCHCLVVQTLMNQFNHKHHVPSQQLPAVWGGCQLFLDMSRAFDRVRRDLLFPRLGEVGIEADLTAVLYLWHLNTAYHLTHQQHTKRIDITRGLRQGCRAAPLLWNIYTWLLLRDLEATTPRVWI